MKIVIAQNEKGKEKLLEELKEKLLRSCPAAVVEILWDEGKGELPYEEIRKADPELFINFDLAGFEQTTLTGGVVYNLLNAKQIHILLKDNLANEKYLQKQLSISMFFYCIGHRYLEHLSRSYPDIPFLKEIGEDGGADAICQAAMEVMEICHIRT